MSTSSDLTQQQRIRLIISALVHCSQPVTRSSIKTQFFREVRKWPNPFLLTRELKLYHKHLPETKEET